MSMRQLRKGVCGVSIPTSDNPNLEEFSIKNFLQLLVLQIHDIRCPGHTYFEYGPQGLSASGYGQFFLFPLSSPEHFSVTSIPTRSVLETISGLYELQDAAKVS